MKRILILLMIVVSAACKKDRKSCWSCYFPISASISVSGIDTTVCSMTEEESRQFQSEYVKELRDKYGDIQPGIGSSCRKVPGK